MQRLHYKSLVWYMVHDIFLEDGVYLCVRCIMKGENGISRCEKIEAGEIIERAIKV